MSRPEIAQLLWKRGFDRTARHRLSQLVYGVARRVEPATAFDASDEWIRVHPSVKTDVELFESFLTASRLTEALELLEARFVPGITRPPSDEFERWRDATELRLRVRLREAGAKTWDDARRTGRWEVASEAAEVLLGLDPASEVALRRLMRAKGHSGRNQEALAAFASFRERLEGDRAESWTPADETQSLLEELGRLGGGRLVGEAGDPEVRRGRVPLVGRHEELASLVDLLTTPAERGAVTAIVIGEAGVGKTRLVEEAVAALPSKDRRIAHGRALEFESDIPLNPFLDSLSGLPIRGAIQRLGEPWASVLLALKPEYHTGDGPPPPPPGIQPGSVPRRLFEAVYRLLLELTEDEVLVLVLEDLHWADETTISLLRFLRRRWDSGALTFVFTLRPEGIRSDSALQHFVETEQEIETQLRIRLAPLDADDSFRLATEVSREIGSHEAGTIVRLAGGIPFLLVELTVEHRTGRLRLDDGALGVVPASLPDSVRRFVSHRLKALDPGEADQLEHLAVIGHPLRIPELTELSGATKNTTSRALDRLTDLRLVIWNDTHVTITHDLIRTVIYENLPPGRRALLHARVGDFLTRRAQRHELPLPHDQLAVHFDRAGEPTRAHEHAIQAAHRAEESGAIPEAIRQWEIARRNSLRDADITEALGRTASLQYQFRNLEAAATLLPQAAKRYRAAGREEEALLAELYKLDVECQLERIDYRGFSQLAESLAASASDAGTDLPVARAWDLQIIMATRFAERTEVRRLFRMLSTTIPFRDPLSTALAKSTLAMRFLYEDTTPSVKLAADAVDETRWHGDDDLLNRVTNRLMVVLHYSAQLLTRRGRIHLSHARDVASRTGDFQARLNIMAAEAIQLLDLGAAELGGSMLLEARERLSREHDSQAVAAFFAVNLGELYLKFADAKQAREWFASAPRTNAFHMPGHEIHSVAAAGIALTHLMEGHLAKAIEIANSLPAIDWWSFDASLIAILHARLISRLKTTEEAVASLRRTRSRLRKRLPLLWIKLGLEELDLLRRTEPEAATKVAQQLLPYLQPLRVPALVRSLEVTR